MVARPEELVSRLAASSDPDSRLKALRDIKNQVIGNKRKKGLYLQLGAVSGLVQILEHSDNTQLLIQSATAAGSLAYGSQQGAEAFLACNGLQPLLRTLWSSDLSLVDASLRALRCVFQVRSCSSGCAGTQNPQYQHVSFSQSQVAHLIYICHAERGTAD